MPTIQTKSKKTQAIETYYNQQSSNINDTQKFIEKLHCTEEKKKKAQTERKVFKTELSDGKKFQVLHSEFGLSSVFSDLKLGKYFFVCLFLSTVNNYSIAIANFIVAVIWFANVFTNWK